MNWSLLVLLFVFFTVMMLILQRTEPKKKLIVLATFGVGFLFTWNFINYRAIQSEALIAFTSAGVINFLFWALIGRYNPVKSSDETIKVYGLDD